MKIEQKTLNEIVSSFQKEKIRDLEYEDLLQNKLERIKNIVWKRIKKFTNNSNVRNVRFYLQKNVPEKSALPIYFVINTEYDIFPYNKEENFFEDEISINKEITNTIKRIFKKINIKYKFQYYYVHFFGTKTIDFSCYIYPYIIETKN